MKAFALTDIGLVREENQDCFKLYSLSDGSVFAVLCDGMGGESAGAEAGLLTAAAVSDRFLEGYREDYSSNKIRNLMISCVCAANSIVYRESVNNPEKRGMGSTCLAVFFRGGIAHIVNVGDSRAYLISTDGITQLTIDHTAVQMYIEQGRITPDEAKSHPRRHMLVRAIGVDKRVDTDYFEHTLSEGSALLLCSDGLYGMCNEDEIQKIVLSDDAQKAVKALVDAANSAGGRDNITVVLISNLNEHLS